MNRRNPHMQRAIAISADGSLLASGGEDTVVKVYALTEAGLPQVEDEDDSGEGDPVAKRTFKCNAVPNGLAFSKDGALVRTRSS